MIIPEIFTVDILYFRPDHRWLLQQFVWQTPDVAPALIRINKFLRHGREERLAVIQSITLTSACRADWRREL